MSSSAPPNVRDHDVTKLREVLSCIHIPTMDGFLDDLEGGAIPHRIFHFWEGFNGTIASSLFHLSDKELDKRVRTLHRAWEGTLSFGAYFRPSPGSDKYFFGQPGDIPGDAREQEAWRELQAARIEAREALRALLTYVREQFPDVRVEQCSAAAWKEYVAFHRKNEDEMANSAEQPIAALPEQSWTVTAAWAAAAAAVLTAALIWLPFTWARIVIVVAAVVFVLVQLHNPTYWYRRTALFVLSTWIGSLTAAGLAVDLRTKGFLATLNLDSPHWSFHLVVGGIVIVLLLLDYKRTSKAVSRAGQLVRNEVAGESAGERERLVSLVREDARATLVHNILQSDSEFFAVDTAGLTREQRQEIILRQLTMKERQMKHAELRKTLIAAAIVLLVLYLIARGITLFASNRASVVPLHDNKPNDPLSLRSSVQQVDRSAERVRMTLAVANPTSHPRSVTDVFILGKGTSNSGCNPGPLQTNDYQLKLAASLPSSTDTAIVSGYLTTQCCDGYALIRVPHLIACQPNAATTFDINLSDLKLLRVGTGPYAPLADRIKYGTTVFALPPKDQIEIHLKTYELMREHSERTSERRLRRLLEDARAATMPSTRPATVAMSEKESDNATRDDPLTSLQTRYQALIDQYPGDQTTQQVRGLEKRRDELVDTLLRDESDAEHRQSLRRQIRAIDEQVRSIGSTHNPVRPWRIDDFFVGGSAGTPDELKLLDPAPDWSQIIVIVTFDNGTSAASILKQNQIWKEAWSDFDAEFALRVRSGELELSDRDQSAIAAFLKPERQLPQLDSQSRRQMDRLRFRK